MRSTKYLNAVLTVIALLLAVLVLRPAANPPAAHAQSDAAQIYFEPGTTTLRSPDGTTQVQGKVAVDLRTGEIWGFPTLTHAAYPVDLVRSVPPVSSPMYLGKFDLAKMRRAK